MRFSRFGALGARGVRRLARDASRTFSGRKVPRRMRLKNGAQLDDVSVRAIPVHVRVAFSFFDEPNHLNRALCVGLSDSRHLSLPRLAFCTSNIHLHPDREV